MEFTFLGVRKIKSIKNANKVSKRFNINIIYSTDLLTCENGKKYFGPFYRMSEIVIRF